MKPSRKHKKIGFADYRSWPGEERWEIIDGEPFAMSSPSVIHQRVIRNLSLALVAHFDGQPCEVFFAPLDVRLSEYDVVQPDLMVVCDPSQVKATHVEGPPNLVIEIVSPSSLRHDRIRKFRLYASAGVKEYWVLHPSPPMAEVYLLDDGGYRAQAVHTDRESLTSPSFPDLTLDLSEIFPFVEVDEVRESAPPYPGVARV